MNLGPPAGATDVLRPELEPLPELMWLLPVNRGYPVPWFVEWVKDPNGVLYPEFRASSKRKLVQAVRGDLCWTCGNKLGSYKAFVIGPMCGVNRISAEPPSHTVCAEWSARNCPFLSRPQMVRRDASDIPIVPPDGNMIERNPGVTLVWVTRKYKIVPDGKGGSLLNFEDPTYLSFWREGRTATRAEIDESISTGLPILAATCKGNKTCLAELDKFVARFTQLLPAA